MPFTQHPTIWFNVTSSTRWQRPDVGVIRTERRLAEEFQRQLPGRIRLCVFDGEQFVTSNSKRLEKPEPCSFRAGDWLLTFGLDWDHNFHFTMGDLRRKLGLRVLACCYDLIPILFPHYCVSDTSSRFAQYFINMAEGAEVIVCISEHTRKDLLTFLNNVGARTPRVEVFRLGDAIVKDNILKLPELPKPFRDRPYALFVSTVERRKNHHAIYHAIRCANNETTTAVKPKCIFVGMAGWGVNDLLNDLRLDPVARNSILHLENVSDQELAALYKGATCVLFPSLYEGWGLPVAEALNYGKAILASPVSSIPEVGGDLVKYLDPLHPRLWGEEMLRLFNDGAYVSKWEQRVKDCYQTHTWSQSAATLIQTLGLTDAPARW